MAQVFHGAGTWGSPWPRRVGDPERVTAQMSAVPGRGEVDERVHQRLAADPAVQLGLHVSTPRRDVRGRRAVADLEVERNRIGVVQTELVQLGQKKVDGLRAR